MRKLGVVAATAVTLTAVAATGAQAGTGTAPLAGAGTAPPAISGLHDPGRIPGRYIVVLQDGAAASQVAVAHERAFGAGVDHVYRSAVRGYSARMSRTVAERVAQRPEVDFVQADSRVSTSAQSVPTGIDRADADTSPTAAIDGADSRVDVDVAVIDTGIDLDHPDLNVYRAGAKNCAVLGVGPDDQHGHGTHVAGTIGALDNSAGVVGMAPGARVWPVKVLNAVGVGTTSEVVCGIDYVTANADQIEVANMSLGGGGEDDGNCGESNDDAEHRAICASVAAGVTYAVAAGNDSADAAGSTPAAYDEVITVSALADFNGQPGGGAAATCRSDVDDTFANFSNYGSDIDLIAPGVCIGSTWKGGGYNTISGTSMASPHVAGAAALYKANNPGASPAQVQAALESAGNTGWDDADDPDNTKEPLLDVTGF